MHSFNLGKFTVGKDQKLTVMTGPCVIEDEEHTLKCAELLVEIFKDLDLNLVFKASFDKANRSSVNSFRGPGLKKGLKILEKVKEKFDVPVLTDVHTPEQAHDAAKVCDVIQIPAFLCRQTDLVLACAETDAVINIKKGQFLAPWDMKQVVDKIESKGHHKIILVDRGTSFGYNNLVSDMRAIPIMQQLGYPVCFDASHSVQLPGGLGTSSGGQREFIPTLARSAIAAGANVLFIESHPNPEDALSDKASVFPLKEMPKLLQGLQKLYQLIQSEHV